VVCRAPRSARRSAAEFSWDTEFVLPRRGVFAVHRRGEMVVADPCTVLVLTAGEDYRVTHPADGGDACTLLAFPPEITQEALGQSRTSHGIQRVGTQLAARRLLVALRQDSAGLQTAEVAMKLLRAIAADVTGQALAQRPGSLARRRAEEVRALLACDPGAAWRLDHIARAVHCSPFLASIVQGFWGPVTDCAGARFRVWCRFAAGDGRVTVPGVPGCAPAPTAPGWSSFRVDGVVCAGQAGAGRAHSRCQQVRNASFQGQSGLILRMRSRAWRASRAGMCQIR